MRPIIRGDIPKDENTGEPIKFKEYGDAKDYLIKNIGSYCSYCERKINNILAVEHIKPKKHNRDLEFSWHNFLLACTNCNSIKGDTKINLTDYFWCNRDNTFLAFIYENGLIKSNSQLTPGQQKIAKNTIELTGLDRKPGHPKFSKKDKRWKQRQEKWDLAQRAYKNLKNNNIEALRETIVELALTSGFWSIWMTVFQNDQDMLKRFIEVFPGTAQNCFDANCNPVHRSGGII